MVELPKGNEAGSPTDLGESECPWFFYSSFSCLWYHIVASLLLSPHAGLWPGGRVKLLYSSSLLTAERWDWQIAWGDHLSLPAQNTPTVSLPSVTQLLHHGQMILFVTHYCAFVIVTLSASTFDGRGCLWLYTYSAWRFHTEFVFGWGHCDLWPLLSAFLLICCSVWPSGYHHVM